MRQLFPTAGLSRSSQLSALPTHIGALGTLLIKSREGIELPLDTLLRSENTNGFLVLHKGQVIMEWYDGFLKPEMQHTVQSISKSIAALVAGVLVDKGLLDTDALVTKYIPELDGSGFTGARIRDLLDMTTSLAFNEDLADPNGDSVKFRSATTGTPKRDDIEVIGLRNALQKIQHGGGSHGTKFHYVTANTDTLGWVLERASGKSYGEVLQDLLWEPLGAEFEATLLLDVYAAPRAGGGLSMTLRDLARIGEMICRMGAFNNQQIVPRWWLQDILSNGSTEAWSKGPRAGIIKGPYRSNFFILDSETGPVLAGLGSYGQWMFVDIANSTVIVRFASESVGSDASSMKHWQQTFGTISRHLNTIS